MYGGTKILRFGSGTINLVPSSREIVLMCTYIKSGIKFRFRLSTMWMGVRYLLLMDWIWCMIRFGKSVG